MAKLVILFIAAIALQGVFGGEEDLQPDKYVEETPRDVVMYIETYTQELVAWITTNKDVEKMKTTLHQYRDAVELITKKLAGKSSLPDNHINTLMHELTNKFRNVLQQLQDPTNSELTKTMYQIASRFEQLCEYTQTGEQPIEVHQFLKSIMIEYCYTVERVCQGLKSKYQMGEMQGTLKTQIESSLMEIFDNIKFVQFDNAFTKRTMMNLIRDYTHKLELILQRFEKMHVPSTQMPETLKEAITSLRSFQSTCKTDELECKRELAVSFEKLTQAINQWEPVDTTTKNLLMHLLTATRNLEFHIYTVCNTVVPHGETTTGFGLQIRTIANGLINALQTTTFDSKEARQILLDQTREFIQNLESVLKKIHDITYTSVHSSKVVENVTSKLTEVITSLKKIIESITDMKPEMIKTHLIANIQEATMEIEKLLWVERETKHYGDENVKGNIYEIFNDFLAVLQHQLIQLQNIYQSTTYKQPGSHLAMQIQAITNSVVVYLRNVPTNDVMIREKLEVQVHHLVKRIQAIISRVGAIENPEFVKAVHHIKELTVSFEQFMERTKISSIKQVVFHFNILVQKIASELKKLSWYAQRNPTESINNTVNNMLSEYLVIIDNIHVKIQRINQVAQVGESPRELALQIEVLADHLRKMLIAFVSDNKLAKQTLMWQTRRFNQILEVIVDQLRAKLTSDSGKLYKEVASNLEEIQSAYKTCMDEMETTNIYQFRMKIGHVIMKASMEIQKLTWIAQSDIQEGHGIQTTFVRSILLEFLLGLQDFHVQMQHNFQVVLSGQSPGKLLMEIQLMSKRIFERLQMLTSDYDQFEEIMAIQLGEYIQTIENTLNLMHHEMKNNGEHNVEIEKIADTLGKISLVLQNVNMKDGNEVVAQFEMSLREYLTGMHSLVMMNRGKVTETQVGSHTGILHGVLSNMLATLRNMYVQMQYEHQESSHEKISDLGHHMATITNNIMPALETIVGSTTPVKQALDVQIFKYARNLKHLIEYLEKYQTSDVKEVITNLREALMLLQQTATSITALTINDLKLHFNKLVQGVGAEMQKLILIQSTEKDDQGFLRNILIKYVTVLKNLHIQIQNISRMSHQSENYQLVGMEIDTAIIELCKSLQVMPKDHKLMAKAVEIQSHELAQLILNIINRYQAAAVLQKNQLFMDIATELKNIQLFLQDITVKNTLDDFNNVILKLAANIQRAAELIEELMWLPEKQVHQTQYKPDVPTFVRVTLHDFLTAVQNMMIQIGNVLVHVDDKNLVLMEEMSRANMNQKVSPGMQMHPETNQGEEVMPKSNTLYHPEMELYNAMRGKDMMGENYRYPENEDVMMYRPNMQMKMMPNYMMQGRNNMQPMHYMGYYSTMNQMPQNVMSHPQMSNMMEQEHVMNYPGMMQKERVPMHYPQIRMNSNMDVPNNYYGQMMSNSNFPHMKMSAMQVPNKYYGDMSMMPTSKLYNSQPMRTYSKINMHEMDVPNKYYAQMNMMPKYTPHNIPQMDMTEMEIPNKYYGQMKMMPKYERYNEMDKMEVPNKYYSQMRPMPQYEDMYSPSMRTYENAKYMNKMPYSYNAYNPEMNTNPMHPILNKYATPKKVAMNINTLTKQIMEEFASKTMNSQQVIYHVREFIKIIDEIVEKLQVIEVADNLKNLKFAFENIIKRATTMNVYQMKMEVCQNFETVSMEFQKLVDVHQYRTSILINNVLEPYYIHLQKINQELQAYPMAVQQHPKDFSKTHQMLAHYVPKESNY